MPTKSKFQDQTFLFTGTLTEFTREEAEALVATHGGKVLSGVTGKLNYLVVGEDAGGKLDKAKALGTVKILTEKEFLKMVPKGDSKIAGKEPAKKLATTASVKSAIKASSDDTGSSNANTSDEVKIGNQIWMAKNLDVTHFRNGDPIPEIKVDNEWEDAGDNGVAAWCNYENNIKNGKIYGNLYNGHAITDPRGLAPSGWHIPTVQEWNTLIEYLGGESVEFAVYFGSSETAATRLKSKKGWGNDDNGSNKSGFSALPGGQRDGGGNFNALGDQGKWWGIDEGNSDDEHYVYTLSFDDKDIVDTPERKWNGFSIRCVKDTQ